MSAATTDVVIEAAHFDPVTIARARAPAQAAERGVQALRARRRPDDLGRSPPAAWPTCWSSTAADTSPRRRPSSARRRPASRSRSTPQLPARVAGFAIGDRDRRRRAAHGRAARSPWRTAGSPPTPAPWRPDIADPNDLVEEVLRIVGYDQGAERAPGRPGRSRADQAAAAAPPGRASRWPRAGYVEALTYPFVGDRDLDGLGLPADDERRATLRIANPLSEQEPLLRTTLLPGLLRDLARNVGRGRADLGLFELGQRLPARRWRVARRRRAWASTARRRSTSSRSSRPPCPTSRCTSASCSPERAARPAGGARPAPAGWADAVEAAREVASRARASS